MLLRQPCDAAVLDFYLPEAAADGFHFISASGACFRNWSS